MTDPLSLAIIAFAFITGGFVKGAAGLGLPVITVAVLASVFGLKSAMALMVVPGIVTNFWQATTGGKAADVMRRIAIFHLPSLVTIWFGTGLLIVLDGAYLVMALGFILF
ncbi:MAG: sulfite exporter TauE/SafE family protein, partial [Pseudomonadota bacterium]